MRPTLQANVLLLVLSSFVAATGGRIAVANSSRLFVDTADGRVRVFHGVNAVQKAPPWHPVVDRFDPSSSLAPQDISDLRAWGLNVVRLGVMWPGVMPAPGQVNHTYLGVMRQLVDDLHAAGINTIVDYHQDVISGKFCGEGVPDWVMALLEQPPLRTSCSGLVPWAASLLGLCKPFKDYNFTIDPATGYPRTDECLAHSFVAYSETPEVVSAWGHFLRNATIREHFADYWRVVSAAFAGAPGVLGYDLVNEPLPGDYYADSSMVLPGHGDLANLQPLYLQLHNAIREADTDTIIFYEPPPFPDTLPASVPFLSGVHSTGFTAGPAGAAGAAKWASKQAMSYHIYSCGFADTKCDSDGDPAAADCGSCDELVDSWMDTRAADVKRLGGGVMLTEFGAVSGDSAGGLAEIARVTNAADRRLLSWAYWQFKYFSDITTVSGPAEGLYHANGTLQRAKLAALSRTYAPAVAGTPTAMRFDAGSGAFRLAYSTAGVSAATRALATEVYLNVPVHYPTGFVADLINATGTGSALVNGTTMLLHANASAADAGAGVDVAIVRPHAGAHEGQFVSSDGDVIAWTLSDVNTSVGASGDDGGVAAPVGFALRLGDNLTWWKSLRISADGQAKGGSYACDVQAQDDQHDPQICTLRGARRHDFLFDYQIELWKAKALGHKTRIQTLPARMFGPLLNKMLTLTWVSD